MTGGNAAGAAANDDASIETSEHEARTWKPAPQVDKGGKVCTEQFAHTVQQPPGRGPHGPELLMIARWTGLRERMHGVSSTLAMQILGRFMQAVDELRASLASDVWAAQKADPAPLFHAESIAEVFARVLKEAEGAAPCAVTPADALEFRREQYGFTQAQMAAVLGIQQSHYSEIINGRRSVPRIAMQRAVAVGVPAAALLGVAEPA